MNLKQFIERERQLNKLLRAAIDPLKELEPQEPFVIIEEVPDALAKVEAIIVEKPVT